jgi:hypothetical protein
MFGSQERRRCDTGGNKPHGSSFGTFRGCELSLQALRRSTRLSITRPRNLPLQLLQRIHPVRLTRRVNVSSHSPHHRRRLILNDHCPPPLRICAAPVLQPFPSPSSPQPIHRRQKLAQPIGTARLAQPLRTTAVRRAPYGRPGNKAAFPAKRRAHFAHRHAPSIACIVI